ncbi:heme oxygenase-like protein [Mytilinidion resinicola]|uniref:Heme oxygenase-like protein n=1 Tax=Mytilinidion resinicola TaxID=574789 RepID=A0A6A6ZAM9_9PEZI|nr:heme oxygenase-like protein [Mytilinidion resinicola]KAF2817267.1 heme oxygenase-like protein [Mytilinidion resinicola]
MAKDPVPAASLPGEINAASRSLHTNLNRLITSRLPLCLPPHTASPQLYTTGLLHFAHVYLTFESLWQDLALSTQQGTPTSPLLSFLLVDPWDADTDSDPENASPPFPRPSPRMLAFLASLRPAGLARSSRLRKDLETLTRLSSTDLSVSLSQFPGAKVQEYCAHIRKAVGKKPHVLVAYAWCYYMAVFSGGRWIRGELRKGGEEFWRKGGAQSGGEAEKKEVVPLDEAGLSFLCFPGLDDGEDIKAEFKSRLAAAEELFTPQEREDVIQESQEIFRYSVGLVEELDELLATNLEKAAAVEAAQKTKETARRKEVQDVGSSGFLHSRWLQSPDVSTVVLSLGCVAWLAVYLFMGSDRIL